MSFQLKDLQNLLYRLITAPSGVAEGLGAEHSLREGGLAALVDGDERLSAEARVDVYADMYFYRLLEVFKEDYPATLAVLGEANFHNLITAYLIEHRPSEPSGGGKISARFSARASAACGGAVCRGPREAGARDHRGLLRCRRQPARSIGDERAPAGAMGHG